MLQHVGEWCCKCTYCSTVVDMSIKMNMDDGNYMLQFSQHDCDKTKKELPGVIYSANALAILRDQVLPRQGYAIITEK